MKVLKKENNIIRNKVNKLENEISNLKSKPSNNLFSNVSFCQNNVLLYFCIFIVLLLMISTRDRVYSIIS